jgi:hypothetical protein
MIKNTCGLTKPFLHYRADTNSRAAIYASPQLGPTYHHNLSSRDCVTVSLKAEGETIYVSSVYLDIRRTVEEPAWLLTISKASFNHCHLLAGIYSNSHSDVWGPTTNP